MKKNNGKDNMMMNIMMMSNMVVKVNKEKLEEELKRIKTILKKRQERRTFDKVDDEER